MTNLRKATLVAVVLAAQVFAIGWLIVRYERVVRCGTEVRFKCRAYDPYDAFRGRYLKMSVSGSTTNFCATLDRDGAPVVVRIEPGEDGSWNVVEAAEAPTDEGLWVKPSTSSVEPLLTRDDKEEDEKWSDFEKRRDASPKAVRVTFPDELFVNEKLAPKAEKILRAETNRDKAVAVYRTLDGKMVLTDIEIDGVSIRKCAKEAE